MKDARANYDSMKESAIKCVEIDNSNSPTESYQMEYSDKTNSQLHHVFRERSRSAVRPAS